VGEKIATEASHFLSAVKVLRERAPRARFDDVATMQRFAVAVCDEEQSRFLEVKLQNVRSRYDTLVKNTQAEFDDPNLLSFRAAVGMAHHLTSVMTQLSHFYERHEDDVRNQEVNTGVARLIDKARVLDRLLNYGLYYVHGVMNVAEPVARRILDTYTTTETVKLEIPNGTFLHARPASLISKIVGHHGTPVEMVMGEDRCYAGSITKVILLAGSHHQERQVTFIGDRGPVRDLRLLFENGLGEQGLDHLPPELSYLGGPPG
jgi:phosphotransferase system HPr-like phosphotransfer protein